MNASSCSWLIFLQTKDTQVQLDRPLLAIDVTYCSGLQQNTCPRDLHPQVALFNMEFFGILAITHDAPSCT